MGSMSEDGDFEVDSEATSQLNEFFRDVDEMKDSMAQIAENVKTIKHIYAELLTCTSTEQSAGTETQTTPPPTTYTRA